MCVCEGNTFRGVCRPAALSHTAAAELQELLVSFFFLRKYAQYVPYMINMSVCDAEALKMSRNCWPSVSEQWEKSFLHIPFQSCGTFQNVKLGCRVGRTREK